MFSSIQNPKKVKKSENPKKTAEIYKFLGWNAYQKKIQKIIKIGVFTTTKRIYYTLYALLCGNKWHVEPSIGLK